jgi:hypothetical protein
VNDVWSSRGGKLGAAALGTFVIAGAISGMTGGAPMAAAAPTTDTYGFVDSTARCAAPNTAVAYGYTASSRVAVCKDDSSGQYQYRGVRVTDGAKLILAAKSTSGGYVAENDGITYTVTSTALVISSGGQQVRSEAWVDFHGTAGTSTSTSTSTSARSSAAPTTSAQSSAAPVTSTPTTPLPPPLPAEVGGGGR